MFPWGGERRSNVQEGKDEELEEMELTEYNFDSFINESTNQLCQNRLDGKLIEAQGSTFSDVYENIIDSLHEAAKEAIGIQGSRSSNKIWWNKEIERMCKYKIQLYMKWLSTKTKEYGEVFKEAKRRLWRCVIAEKNKTWDKKCRDIETYIGGRKCTET